MKREEEKIGVRRWELKKGKDTMNREEEEQQEE